MRRLIRQWLFGSRPASHTEPVDTACPRVLPSRPGPLVLIWEDGRRDAVADPDDALSLACKRYHNASSSAIELLNSELVVHGAQRARLVGGPDASLAVPPPDSEWQLLIAWRSGRTDPVTSMTDIPRIVAENVSGYAKLDRNLLYVDGELRARLRLDRKSDISLPTRTPLTSLPARAPRTPPTALNHGRLGSRLVYVRSHYRRAPRRPGEKR